MVIVGAPAAFGVSIVGLFKDKKKLPAIIGLVLSALAGLGYLILVQTKCV